MTSAQVIRFAAFTALRRIARAWLVALALAVPWTSALARPSSPVSARFIIDTWRHEDGLPGNAVTSIQQTRDGYLWIASFNGLARFDGTRFTRFQAADYPGMTSDRLLCMFEDRQGVLWIGTEGAGLLRLADGRFSSLTTRDGLSNDVVFSLAEDPEGHLWIGTLSGLNRIADGKVSEVSGLDEALPSPSVDYLLADPDGTLWLTTKRGIASWRDGRFEPFRLDDPSTHRGARVERQADGSTWIRLQRGVIRITSSGQITVFQEGANGVTWADNADTLCEVREDRMDAWHLGSKALQAGIRTLYEDREGGVWIGTWASGLVRLRPRRVATIDRQSGLANDVAMSLREDDDGTLWVALNCGGVSLVRDGQVQPFVPAGDRCVWSLLSTGTDEIWMGTWGDGLLRYSGGHLDVFTKGQGFADDVVLSLFQDRAGDLWVGTYEQGACRYADGLFTQYSAAEGLTGRFISSFAERPDGELWIGSNGGGLFRKSGDVFQRFSKDDGLPDEGIRTLFADEDGILWIGTGRGLTAWDGARFHAFTPAHGLIADVVYQILQDDTDHLWLGTHQGLLRVQRSDLTQILEGRRFDAQVLRLDLADGLPSLECTGAFSPAGLKSRSGLLHFSTIKGVVVVDPENLRLNTRVPTVHIEALFVETQTRRPSHMTGREAMETPQDMERLPSELAREMVLPAGRQRLEIHYTATSLLDPAKVRFRYRMVGFDRQWIEAGSRRIAYYTNLRPGRYQFRVMACNNDGIWNEEGATLQLFLPPQFHQTNGFYALSAVTLGLAALGLLRVRLRYLQKQRQRLEATVVERTRSLRAEVAERERAEEEARSAKEVAETANQAKSQFLAQMSHELRTPLNGVIGMSRLLLETPLNHDQRDLASTVKISAESLLCILNDILDFSKIEAGKLALERVTLDLREVLDGTLDLVAERAESKNLELNLDVATSVPPLLLGDPGRLRQILLNLLSNAVKFTERGEVNLLVTAPEILGDRVTLRFDVADSGIGIAPEAQSRLFHAFEQADKSTTRKYGGTGLGLAISRRLVAHMDGQIGFVSHPGRGSTFWFTARFEIAARASTLSETPPTPDLQGLRVLIADDNPTQRSILQAHLAQWGAREIQSSDHGTAALRLLQAAARHGTPFHLAILDQVMPGMDHLDLVRAIRGDPRLAGVRLVLLHPRTSPPCPMIAKEPEVDACIAKPVRQSVLARALADTVDRSPNVMRRDDSPVTAPLLPQRRDLKVLVAEDNLVNQKVACRQLEKLGYRPDLAVNGWEALAAVERSFYDVILMDCHMPEMDGFEATRRIRIREADRAGEPGTPRSWIVAMTANAMPGDRDECLRVGMDDYIAKPVDLDRLRELLTRLETGPRG